MCDGIEEWGAFINDEPPIDHKDIDPLTDEPTILDEE